MKQKTGDISNNIYTLEYNSLKFYIKVEYDERKNDIIEISVEKERVTDGNFYNIKKIFMEFTEEKLFRFCDNLKEIYNLILKLINEKLVLIKEINDNFLILSLKMFVSGSENPIIADIKLLKKKYDQDILIKKLYEQNEELTLKERVTNDAIKRLFEKIDKLEEENRKQYERIEELTLKEHDKVDKIKTLSEKVNKLEKDMTKRSRPRF